MRVDASVFKEFISRVHVGGLIRDVVLDFTEDGLRVTSLDESKAGGVSGILFKDVFTDYQTMRVPIHDISRVVSALKMVDDEIGLSVSGNVFEIDGGGYRCGFAMTREGYLRWPIAHERWPRLYEGDGYEVESGFFDRVKKSATLFDSANVVARAADSELTMTVSDKSGDHGTAVANIAWDGRATATYGPAMLRILRILDGTVKVMFNDDKPITFTSEDERMRVQWMASPVVTV